MLVAHLLPFRNADTKTLKTRMHFSQIPNARFLTVRASHSKIVNKFEHVWGDWSQDQGLVQKAKKLLTDQ